MPLIKIYEAGQTGVIRDLAPHELPPEIFSDAKNVRFRDNRVEKIKGDTSVFEHASFTIAPYEVAFATDGDVAHWVYLGLDKAYVTTGGAHSDITRAAGDYTGAENNIWIKTRLGGIPIFTNGVDVPQFWADISTSQALQNLTNWPSGYACKVLRALGPHLIAFNITQSSTRYPSKILWSHPADPGALPSSWDVSDATKDAGETFLTEGGPIFDAAKLGRQMVIYQESATSTMQFIGGNEIFSFDPLLEESGILGPRCVRPYGKRAHFVVTGDDIILMNGPDPQSLIDKRLRRWLFARIDSTNYQRSFVVVNREEREMWFCYPETEAAYPNAAAIWNWVDGTWSFRELDSFMGAAEGAVDDSVDESWDSDAASWDSDVTPWDTLTYRGNIRNMLFARPVTGGEQLRQGDMGFTFNGTEYESFVEREGLALIGRDWQGRPKVDTEVRKLVTEIWIRSDGAPFDVQIGASDDPEQGTVWSAKQTFTPGVDRFLNFTVQGRYIGVRFSSQSGNQWNVKGYDLNIENIGKY